MPERTKKILFILFFVSFSIGMGYLLYWMFIRTQPPPRPAPTETGLQGKLPGAGPGEPRAAAPSGVNELPSGAGVGIALETPALSSKTQLLRDGVTQAVSPSGDGNGARFYSPEDGRFYRVTPDGTIKLISEKQFFNVSSVYWGNKTDEVVLAFPDGSKLFYDFEDKRQVTLPKHWDEFDFSPDDQRVAAKSLGVDPNNRFLIISNPDGTEAKAIEPLGSNADQAHVSWSPNGQIVAYSMTGEPQPDGAQQILFVGQNRENFTSLIAPGFSFLPNWSPNGTQLLFSVWSPVSDNKPVLWLSGGDPSTIGANRKNLNINTWADKCAWADDANLYCGVPQSMPSDAGVLRSQFATLPDDVYHIDLARGTTVKLDTIDQTHPIRQPVISKDKMKLIFTDAETGKLYSYDLR